MAIHKLNKSDLMDKDKSYPLVALDFINECLKNPVMAVKGIDGAWVGLVKTKVDIYMKLGGLNTDEGMHDVKF